MAGDTGDDDLDGDACLDRSRGDGGVTFTMTNVRGMCPDEGAVVTSVCLAWDNNAMTECTGRDDLRAGRDGGGLVLVRCCYAVRRLALHEHYHAWRASQRFVP